MVATVHFTERRKWWIIIASILFVVLVIIFFPNLLKKWKIHQLHLDQVESIEYIQYEGRAFGTPIQRKKVIDVNQQQIRTLIEDIELIDTPEDNSKQRDEMLFFYHKDGTITNAYIYKNQLGFQYGRQWMRVETLRNFIKNMNSVETVKVK